MSHAHLACKYPRHCRLKPPLSYASQNTLDRRVNKRMLNASYVGSWHKTDAQRLTDSGRLTGALPTFGAECRFTVVFQTQFQAVSKVAV